MIIIADTCSLLILLRLNPDMLIESKFHCCTTQEVREEILCTKKFADKYPWRNSFRNKIQAIPAGHVCNAHGYQNALFAVKSQLECYDLSEGSYNLSKEDRSLIVLTQILPELPNFSSTDFDDITISTTDMLLKQFAEKRFDIENIEPLNIINSWITDGIWTYDKTKHESILQEWANQEPKPSITAKKLFKKLTGHSFPD